ncbi:hypothetical protein [Planobispora rosea]|uniref:hypothetical protein n=1 Tax=Planobispora rosea TaxID=35762 RepID=UPI00083A6AEC|nr:hypothetical protein [Planobispora rosea]
MVASRYRRQDAAIESAVPQLELLGEKETRLAEQGAPGIEHIPDHPGAEVVDAAGDVTEGELAPIGRGAADDRVDQKSQGGIGDTPEITGQAVVKGGDDQFQTRPATQWCRPGEQRPHEGQRRPAQQQPHGAAVPLPLRSESTLDQRGRMR